MDLTDPCEAEDVEDPPTKGGNPSEGKDKEETKGYGSVDTSTSPKNSLWTIQTPVSSREEEEDTPPNDLWSDPKPETGGGEESPLLASKETFHERPGKPEKPKQHCFVSMFYAIESFAVVTNLAMLVSQVLPLIVVSWEDADPAYLALKIYLVIFAIIFFFVEIDLESISFLRKASFLRTYCSRGFLYSFFGLICYEEADSEKAYTALEDARAQDNSKIFRVVWFALINQIAAISLLAVGCLYFLLGLLCLQRVRNRYVYDDRQKKKAYREALDKWDQGI